MLTMVRLVTDAPSSGIDGLDVCADAAYLDSLGLGTDH